MPRYEEPSIRPQVLALPLASLSPSRKRMREDSIPDSIRSDAELDLTRDTQVVTAEQDKLERSQKAAATSIAPLSRKQRRKKLRSVSKQSSILSLESLPAIDSHITTHGSKHGASSPPCERVHDEQVSADVARNTIIYLQLLADEAKDKVTDVVVMAEHGKVMLQLLKMSLSSKEKEVSGPGVVVQVEEITVEDTSTDEIDDILIESEYASSSREIGTRKQSVSISVAEILVAEEGFSLDGDVASALSDETMPEKLLSSKDEEEDVCGPSAVVNLEDEAFPTPDIAEKEYSFMDTIRQMLTINNDNEHMEIALHRSNPSPLPQKYLSLPKISIDASVSSLTSKLQEAPSLPEYGPQPPPQMPRSWREASSWDMTPPPHGTCNIYTDASQIEQSFSALSPTPTAYNPPALTTLWAISRYMEQKQARIDEHAKREGLRWQVLKAVERNLDVQKRRENMEWPKNWNEEVEKDGVYMQKMVSRVGFLMKG